MCSLKMFATGWHSNTFTLAPIALRHRLSTIMPFKTIKFNSSFYIVN